MSQFCVFYEAATLEGASLRNLVSFFWLYYFPAGWTNFFYGRRSTLGFRLFFYRGAQDLDFAGVVGGLGLLKFSV